MNGTVLRHRSRRDGQPLAPASVPRWRTQLCEERGQQHLPFVQKVPLGAAGPTLIGALAAATGSFPLAISMLSLIYVVGLPFISPAPETANRPLAK